MHDHPRLLPAGCAALLTLALALPALASDDDRFEITVHGGLTFPFWEQTFAYEPGPVTIPVPGLSVTQSGEFVLRAKGGSALGGSFAFFPVPALGAEFRLDNVGASVETVTALYTIDATLPAPLPPYSTFIDLAAEGAVTTRTTISSLNLALRTTGATRFRISGGLSHLPDTELAIEQTLGLGVTGVTAGGTELQVATLGFRAKAGAESREKRGYNVGVGLGFSIGDRVDLVGEIRYFHFPIRTLEWELDDTRKLSTFEQALLERILASVPPAAYDPIFVQGTVGLSIRF